MSKTLYEKCFKCKGTGETERGGLYIGDYITCQSCDGIGFVESALLQTVLETAIDSLRNDIAETEKELHYYLTTTFVAPEAEKAGKQIDMLTQYKQGLRVAVAYLQNSYIAEFGKRYEAE